MLKHIRAFTSDVFRYRQLIYELAKRDFQQQYQGSYLGFIWVFLQPLAYVAILYAVFSLGFRTGETEGMPFSLYLIAGMVAWLYLADNIISICGVIKGHAFLVKKVDFRLSILPLVKILGSLPTHLSLLLVVVALAWYQGYAPSIYALQLVYYLFAMCVLLLGVGLLTSSTSIFVKDVSRLVGIAIQFGFWLTPIIWSIQMVPVSYQWAVKLNPAHYILTGYRDSLVNHVPFWAHPMETLWFWATALLLLMSGAWLFQRLRPHFAEVL